LKDVLTLPPPKKNQKKTRIKEKKGRAETASKRNIFLGGGGWSFIAMKEKTHYHIELPSFTCFSGFMDEP